MVTSPAKEERIFLAGCVKTVMLSNGTIEDHEIIELGDLNSHLAFCAFDQRLVEFERQAEGEEAIREMSAARVSSGA